MKKSIYKITNLINGKIYIGQSKNPKRRFNDHCHCLTSVIGNAINKYGKDNFYLEIIESDIENYNEREKYWIQYYNALDMNVGYNVAEGGEEPPVVCGEDSALAKLSNDEFDSLVNDIINTDISFIDLAKKYNISEVYVSALNQGRITRLQGYSFPLRINGNEHLPNDIVDQVIYDLTYTTKSTCQIARDYNLAEVTVWKINKGKLQYIHNNIQYPIRDHYCLLSNCLQELIIEELKDNKHSYKQIEKMFNLSCATLSRFNNGKICYKEGREYPIRPSSKRVYKPVETIPSEIGSRITIDT